MVSAATERFEHNPVRTRRIVCGDGAHDVELRVFCGRRAESVPLEKCRSCDQCAAFPTDAEAADAEVLCWSTEESPPSQPWSGPGTDIRVAALRTPIGAILRRQVVCVHPDTSLETAATLLAESWAPSLPVVDERDKLVGVVSEGDLCRERTLQGDCSEAAPRSLGAGFHVEELASGTVGEVMAPLAVVLSEDTPISYAAGLLASQDLECVPVVRKRGAVVGMLTATDALRWFARTLGFVFDVD